MIPPPVAWPQAPTPIIDKSGQAPDTKRIISNLGDGVGLVAGGSGRALLDGLLIRSFGGADREMAIKRMNAHSTQPADALVPAAPR